MPWFGRAVRVRGGLMNTPRIRTRMALALSATALIALLSAASPLGAEEDTPPIISNGIAAPSSLPSTGGEVVISADVVDDFGQIGITMVYADVFAPDGSWWSVQLFYAGDD